MFTALSFHEIWKMWHEGVRSNECERDHTTTDLIAPDPSSIVVSWQAHPLYPSTLETDLQCQDEHLAGRISAVCLDRQSYLPTMVRI